MIEIKYIFLSFFLLFSLVISFSFLFFFFYIIFNILFSHGSNFYIFRILSFLFSSHVKKCSAIGLLFISFSIDSIQPRVIVMSAYILLLHKVDSFPFRNDVYCVGHHWLHCILCRPIWPHKWSLNWEFIWVGDGTRSLHFGESPWMTISWMVRSHQVSLP